MKSFNQFYVDRLDESLWGGLKDMMGNGPDPGAEREARNKLDVDRWGRAQMARRPTVRPERPAWDHEASGEQVAMDKYRQTGVADPQWFGPEGSQNPKHIERRAALDKERGHQQGIRRMDNASFQQARQYVKQRVGQIINGVYSDKSILDTLSKDPKLRDFFAFMTTSDQKDRIQQDLLKVIRNTRDTVLGQGQNLGATYNVAGG